MSSIQPAPVTLTASVTTLESTAPAGDIWSIRARIVTRSIGQIELPADVVLDRVTIHSGGDVLVSLPFQLAGLFAPPPPRKWYKAGALRFKIKYGYRRLRRAITRPKIGSCTESDCCQ